MIKIYYYYKIARDTAWKTAIYCLVNTLPVDLGAIAQRYDISIKLYSQCIIVDPYKISEDGFSVIIDGIKTIFLNENQATIGRKRFTLGHELGHCLMDHPLDQITARTSEQDSDNPIEQQANIFARDILMPACVLNAIGAVTPQQIAKVCNVSLLSATIRAERLAVLRERNKFGTSPLERQALEQFQPYIDSYNLNLN